MRSSLFIIWLFGIVLLNASPLPAASRASAVVQFAIEDISELAATGTLASALALVAPSSAESISTFDSATMLHFTSVVHPSATRSLTASLSGALPDGCALEIKVSGSSSGGSFGTPSSGPVRLHGPPCVLMTGIGSCATGSLAGGGVGIAYRLVVVDATRLIPGQETTAMVTFSLE